MKEMYAEKGDQCDLYVQHNSLAHDEYILDHISLILLSQKEDGEYHRRRFWIQQMFGRAPNGQ